VVVVVVVAAAAAAAAVVVVVVVVYVPLGGKLREDMEMPQNNWHPGCDLNVVPLNTKHECCPLEYEVLLVVVLSLVVGFMSIFLTA
jgi:hypothetical protein